MRLPIVTLAAFGVVFGCACFQSKTEDRLVSEVQSFTAVTEQVTAEKKDMAFTEEIESLPHNIEEDIKAGEYVSPYNFEQLNAINQDIVAWMTIPETEVNYPIVFDGTEEYVHKNMSGDYSYTGTPFVDRASGGTLKESVNIVYGHNMKDGSMFATIDEYNEESFMRKHDTILLYLEDEEISLCPVAAMIGKADAKVRELGTGNSLIEFSKDKTLTAGTLPLTYGELYVFITCNYSANDYRTYLICTKKKKANAFIFFFIFHTEKGWIISKIHHLKG